MALLLLGLIVLAAPAQGAPARADDPYQAMARKIAFAARAAGLKSLVVVPFKSLAVGDELGGRIVSERIALEVSGGGGLEVLDGRQLELEGAGRRRAPDGPADPALEVELFEEILRQFALVNLRIQDTHEESKKRERAAEMLTARQLESIASVKRLERRLRHEAPEAEALVTGVLAPLSDGRIEVHVRLGNAATYTVIATVSAKVEKDWGEPPPPAPPRDYSAPAGLAGAAAVATWFLIRTMKG